ncbi:unnamed protein product, partial [Acanthocheilonema viteae]
EPTIGNSNLTQSDLNRLLDLDEKSYRLDGSDDYETPRMSRLPLNYYRRKWAFEKARKAGLLYYIYFCACDFVSELIPKSLAMIFNIIMGILRFIISCLWYVVNKIFPNPEHFTVMQRKQLEPASYLEEHQYSAEEHEKLLRVGFYRFFLTNLRQCSTVLDSCASCPKPSRTSNRETVRNSQATSSNSLVNKLGRSFANMITFGYFSKDNVQHDITRNVRRRVRTSSYEYSEDRGLEINNQSVRATKPSKGLVESFFFKLFYLTFIAALSPVKTCEFTIGKIAWLFRGFSHSTYDLRSRTVYKNLSPEKTLPYTNRFANFLSKIATSCFLTFLSPIKKIVSLPFIIFSYVIGQFLGSNRSEQSLQQQAMRTSERHEKKERNSFIFQIFYFLIDLLCSCAAGFIFILVFVQSVPFYIAESIRERAAYALAYMFGPKSALLVGYEEVRQVKRKGLTTDLKSPAAKNQQKMIHTTAHDRSQLFPTQNSVKCSSVFWRWLFPLIILLLLLITSYKRHDNRDDVVTEAFDKIQQKLFHVSEWKQYIGRGLNFVLRNILYLISVILRFLYDLILYPAKLYGAMTYPRETIEQMVQLPKYVYIAGELAIIHFFESVRVLGSRMCVMIRQVSIISEWIRTDNISENVVDMFLYVRNLISSAVQYLLALLSYFISIAAQLIPVVNRKTINIIRSNSFNQQQTEWSLEHLRYEKESLESEVLHLHRERELEEDRYKNINKALRIVEKSASPKSTDKQLKKSSLNNDELFQYTNDENFLNYMANLRKMDDEELKKRLFAIEKRLMERLDTLSEKIEKEIAQKIVRTEKSDVVRSALSNVGELSELSSSVGNLRTQFEQLRQEKEANIAQFAHSIVTRDIKRSDDLNALKTELNKKVKDDLDKVSVTSVIEELSFSLNRFEKASLEEREAFRLEIMKAVENRVVALFASYIAEKTDTVSETRLSSVLGLSESDFIMIKKMITDALDMYDADKTGKVDYALESSGASVISTRCTEPYKENSRLESIFGIPLWYSSYSPRAVIQHRPLAAGECWAFRGKGYLTIRLSHPIYVTEVSYEHLHSTLHPDGVLKSAPKLFQVYSYKAVDDLKSKSLIGQYEYDIKGRALQTFRAQNELNTSVSIVELVVQSNWGSNYTCLYRFRVHGQKA